MIVAAAAALAACRGESYWVDKLQADPLYRRAEQLRDAPTCSASVPIEFGRTFPVPLPGPDGRFEVLFYPSISSPGKSVIMGPRFVGTFARSGGTDACAALPAEKGAPSPLGAAVPEGLSMKAYYRSEAVLFASLDKAAALYAKGGSPDDAGRKDLVDFVDAFTAASEPGLRPDYYRVNPEFWEWLRKEAGRSIPKP
jgi:hypothetical protein